MICTKTEMFDLISRCLAKFEVDMATGEITWASPRMEELFGYDLPGELEGKLVETLIPESMRENHKNYRAEFAQHPMARQMGRDKELFGQRRNGSTFPVEVILMPGMAGPGSNRRLIVLGIVFDMSTRRGGHSGGTSL